MSKKKRKMTKAQAAAARRDDRPKRAESNVTMKDSGPKDRGLSFTMRITFIMIAVIVVLSLVFTIGPMNGMFG